MLAIILFLITFTLFIFLLVKGITEIKEPWGDSALYFWIAFLVLGFGIPLSCAAGVQWNMGEKKLTGYIYAAEDDIGDLTKGHLRYSLNAGSDDQPAFCVRKADGQMIKDLAGSGKKVEVIIPAGFVLAEPWNCGIPAQVKVVEESAIDEV